jgi:hypothetical protein
MGRIPNAGVLEGGTKDGLGLGNNDFNGGDEQRMVGGKVAIEELDLGDCLTV